MYTHAPFHGDRRRGLRKGESYPGLAECHGGNMAGEGGEAGQGACDPSRCATMHATCLVPRATPHTERVRETLTGSEGLPNRPWVAHAVVPTCRYWHITVPTGFVTVRSTASLRHTCYLPGTCHKESANTQASWPHTGPSDSSRQPTQPGMPQHAGSLMGRTEGN